MEITPLDEGIDLLYGKDGPTPRQIEFRDGPSRFKLYGGAMGGGKSVALCAEGLRLSLAYEGNRGFLCRHESTAFKNTTLATLLKLIEEVEGLTGQKIVSNHHRTDKVIYFLNGSSIMYGALGDASDFERLKSLEIGWFGIDEASECAEGNYQTLKSRLRWKLSSGEYPPFFGLLASNPEPGWVKNTFVVPQRKGEPKPNHSFIQALPRDNPHLPTNYLDVLRESNPEHWVQKYIEGSWDALEGQIWPMFDFNLHILKPFVIPEGWRKFRAIDHGQSNPTCCLWFAVDPDSNIFVYREYYSPGVVSSHCSTIRSLSAGEEYISTYLPPECWGKTMEKDTRLWSVVEEYGEHGIYCARANNEVLAGLNRVGEFLLLDKDRIHPINGEQGSPSLFLFNTCRNLIDEIPDYTWKEQGGEVINKERPVKKHDHACDALRYGVMSRPSPSAQKKVYPMNSFEQVRKRLIEARKGEKRGRGTVHEIFSKLGRG